MNDSRCFWAKITNKQELDGCYHWLSVHQHALDTMFVAIRLFDEYLSPQQQNNIINGFHGDRELAIKIIKFLCAVHDIGKISPLFSLGSKLSAEQKKFISDKLDEEMITPLLATAIYEKQIIRHCFSGAFFLKVWLEDTKKLDDKVVEQLCAIVNGHHGEWRKIGRMTRKELKKELISGNELWQNVRYRFLSDMAEIAGLSETDWTSINKISLNVALQTMLTGLVIMSDWISSNTDFFPLLPGGNVSDMDEQDKRIESAFQTLSLPLSYSFESILDESEILEQRFGIENGTMNDMQKMVYELSKQISENGKPALMIIQEEMGKGKTEASLIAAENLSRKRTRGTLFALPTQATTNAMLSRFISWISSLSPSLGFAMQHSNVKSNKTYDKLRSQSVLDENTNELPHVNTWFEGSRKGILAPFALCTVDQILMLALNSKFVALKHLGIGTKTIIIDEIHSCDLYMECFLNKALEWLAASGVSVVILSATLSKQQCSDMLRAYESGARLFIEEVFEEPTFDVNEIGYPSISIATAGQIETHDIVRTDLPKQYEINMEPGWSDEKVISSAYNEISNGGIIAIVCNTVGKLQDLYEIAERQKPEDVELISLHSRYTSKDRSKIETRLVDLLGKRKTIENGRPAKALILGTQVIEQSLDIDVDRMFTYLAPIDAILQRAGREHRHAIHDDGRISELSVPKITIIGYDIKNGKVKLDKGSSVVYGEHLLLRTLSTLATYDREQIQIPNDVKSLMDAVYSEEAIMPMGDFDEWGKTITKAQEQYEKQKRLLELQASRFILNSPDDTNDLIGLIGYDDTRADNDYTGGVRVGISTAQAILLVSDGETIRFASGQEKYVLGTMRWAPQDVFDNTVPLPPNVSGIYDEKDPLTGERQDLILENISQEHIQQYHLGELATSSYAYGKKILVLPDEGSLRIGKYLIIYGRQGMKATRD